MTPKAIHGLWQRRLSAELDKLNSLAEEGKPEKDFTTAKIKSEIVTLQLTSLHDYVIEEEKETQLRLCSGYL